MTYVYILIGALVVAAGVFVMLRRRSAGQNADDYAATPLPPDPIAAPERQPQRPAAAPTQAADPAPYDPEDPINMQIELLDQAGLHLTPGLTRDHLLAFASEADLSEGPFGLILFVYAEEISDGEYLHPVCPRAGMFDTECINGPGDYSQLVRKIARIGGVEDAITLAQDNVSPSSEGGELHYQIGTIRREFSPVVEDKWVDSEVLVMVMHDVQSLMTDRRLWTFDNGQAFGLLALDDDGASLIHDLAPGLVEPVQ
ncbi:hypothetical protein [Pseudoprimorskyibacter insulae]|uniref:Uncharacterized protein n=1 Tax=Pseudoprimorskyibacter insulae TaxID=1695997 RepID=A0A2R8AV52_9RHOB|nr:hypothetical protein [Pseudoprimorskyibacter insulae]SPF79774.1 hypothetical protein PRI8871_01571 [Pseudoprimorskyibacter insulae]